MENSPSVATTNKCRKRRGRKEKGHDIRRKKRRMHRNKGKEKKG